MSSLEWSQATPALAQGSITRRNRSQRRVRKAILVGALVGLWLVSGCAEDTAAMNEKEAIAECHRYVRKDVPDMRFNTTAASRDDQFWEVSGTTDRGRYRCVVDAVEHRAFSGLWDS